MYFYYILLAFTLIQLTFTANDMKDKGPVLSCYKCMTHSKKPMPECEMDPFPKMKDLKMVKPVNCTKKGQLMPKCYTAKGVIKDNDKFVIRDCGYANQGIEDGKCGVSLADWRIGKVNACIKACEKDNCNSAQHLHSNDVNFLVQLLLMSMVVFGLSDKLNLLTLF